MNGHPYLQLAFAMTLSLASLTLYPASVQTRPNTLISQTGANTPEPPPPENQREPGGGLGAKSYKPSCSNPNKSLTALVPIENWVLTTSEHPTFWFYVPDSQQAVNYGRFSLLARDGKQKIYQTRFELPQEPGIVSISLPASLETALEEGTIYYWDFSVNCKHNTSLEPDLLVYGWARRVTSTPETERQIREGKPDIWYDALTRLAYLRLASPQEQELTKQWYSLLKSVDLQNLAQKPLVGSVLISEE